MNHQYWVERRERMRERRRVCELTEQSRERTAREQAVERTAWTERVLIIKRLQDHRHSGVSCTQTRADTGRTCSRCMPVQQPPKTPVLPPTPWWTSFPYFCYYKTHSYFHWLLSFPPGQRPGVGAPLIVSELTLNVKEGLFLLSNKCYLEYTLRKISNKCYLRI